MKKIILLLFIFMLAGCAATVPLATDPEDHSAKLFYPEKESAVVYVFRENGFLGRAFSFPISVNDKVVGWLAPGTYYKLTLDPGQYNFGTLSILNKFEGAIGGAPNIRVINLKKGANHYLKLDLSAIPVTTSLIYSEESAAIATIKKSQLVRFDYRGLNLSRLTNVKVGPQEEYKQQVKTESFTPLSQSQRDSILKVLGAVLLVGLFILAGAASSYDNAPPPRPLILPQQVQVQKVEPQKSDPISRTFITTGGNIVQVSGDKIYSPTMATSWSVNGDSIRGTDGSSYRVSGNRIYSEDGRAYTASGNTLRGDDGSICTATGTLLSCR